MKILITNTVMLNAGVAAMFSAVRALVEQEFGEHAQCIVYDQNPEVAQRLYPDVQFRKLMFYRASRLPRRRRLNQLFGGVIGRINRARFGIGARLWAKGKYRRASWFTTAEERFDLEQYRTADLIISSGGTYLVDNYDLEPRIFDFELTELMRQPLVLFTQSIGPLKKPENRERLRPILERAEVLLLRDAESLEHLRQMGVNNSNAQLSADAVFCMESGNMRQRAMSGGRRSAGRPKAAISVRHWPYFKTMDSATGMSHYRQALAGAAEHLVRRRGFDVVFISTCQGIPEYWFNDSDVAKEILALIPEDVRAHVSVDAEFRAPEQVVQAMKEYDLVISTRFHMAILSMVAGAPTIAISYEFKTDELYRGLGIADWMMDMESIDAERLNRIIDHCLSADRSRLLSLAEMLERERQRVVDCGALLRGAARQNRQARKGRSKYEHEALAEA
jgi:colanic acid/amylovoran biosynthesis protein